LGNFSCYIIMKKITVISLFFLLVISISCSENKEVGSSISTEEQNVPYERNFLKVDLVPIQLDEKLDSLLINPIQLKIFNNQLYVVDYSPMTIYRFNLSGDLDRILGNGRGRGPGEIQQIMDFDVAEGKIYVSDLNNFKVAVYTKEGEHIKDILTEERPTRILTIREELYGNSIPSEYLVTEFDKEGKSVEEFGKFIEDQYENSIVYTGEFGRSNKNIVFTMYQTSKTVVFDDKKDPMVLSGPEAFGFPEMVFDESSGRREKVSKNRDIWQTLAKADNEEIVIATTLASDLQKNPDDPRTILDFYNAENGSYKHSIMLPRTVYQWRLFNDKAYFLSTQNDTLGAYSIEYL